MGGDGKVFTLAQVSEHNTNKDCWLIINGKVYDVTKFLEDHPGGDEVLLSATGKDATDDFEDVGHSDSAREMMNEYYVGEIDSSTIPKKTTYKPPKQPHYNQDKTSEFIIKLLQFLVPLAILGLAVGISLQLKNANLSSGYVVVAMEPVLLLSSFPPNCNLLPLICLDICDL
nr:cytochrome b5 isoform b [Quercus suber]